MLKVQLYAQYAEVQWIEFLLGHKYIEHNKMRGEQTRLFRLAAGGDADEWIDYPST